jgi:hypothetical protein
MTPLHLGEMGLAGRGPHLRPPLAAGLLHQSAIYLVEAIQQIETCKNGKA